MKQIVQLFLFTFLGILAQAQPPKLYIHIVSHNEPDDNLQQNLKYQIAKNKAITMANIIDSKNVKWNLQSSDGFVFGARNDQNATGTNIFKTLANAPYKDNIEIDPRSKNFAGRNIADQYYLLDSLGALPTKTVGGFLYYVCPPNSDTLIDWWQYTDTVVGEVYGNKVKFEILSGAGSLAPHCNDLNDFGIFKPDTTNNFYHHNPNRNLWCVGVGCAPVLDSLDDEQAIIDLIQGQVDSIQKGYWPADKFYVTRIMTNQREYGPLFFQKIAKVIDSLNLIPSSQLQWATIEETFQEFTNWQQTSSLDFSMWQCGQTSTAIKQLSDDYKIVPNPSSGAFKIIFDNNKTRYLKLYDSRGVLMDSFLCNENYFNLDLRSYSDGLYIISSDENNTYRFVKSSN